MTLRLSRISKHFGTTVALDGVSFSAIPGEVHALLGENGAGKSTLMDIAYGMIRPEAGMIEVQQRGGVALATPAFASPREARAAGIGMVHQHFTSIPAFTVSENIALTAGWTETGRAAERRAAHIVARLGLPLAISAHVESLSAQMRQRLEIVKALATDASILLLDEPTAVLAPREVDELLEFLRGFAAAGGIAVLITHKLDEVFRVADRVTVLRRGVVTLTGVLAEQTPHSLAHAMIGADLARPIPLKAQPGVVAVEASRLSLTRGGQLAVVNASFQVRSGEIVGVAAIEGNGQRELLRAIAGVDDVVTVAGTLEVAGPVAFIPEDRSSEALIPSFTLAENLLLGTLDQSSWWLDWNAIRRDTQALLASHDIRAGGPESQAATLSGGNQQKLVFARALARQPRVIVAENPVRGLDIQAADMIQERIRAAARNGAAVIMHSSDVDEVLALADRVLVLRRGEVQDLPSDPTREQIGDALLAMAAAR